ncbi:MAG: UDP-4-amino-4,6-dideoxy-N-acetyl-beta-L-altrosamine transaminase [Candidatus Aenigmarchaeota archaeon]|nr:UDP-4-amino-4,6-dideoxy-N-acetyl-beta-L-altrosamine transaminase [Candidatus Aenigmarchaeota archaeon]
MNFIPYGHQEINDEDIKEVVSVLKSDWITTGPKIKEFEDALCSYINCKYCVVVNSGTSALDITVQSLNLPKGSEVITTPFTFVATSNSIIYNDLTPVFADIQKDTFNIDPKEIRKKITKNTKAIIYMDYAGQPCDINEIKKIADEFGLYLIEDACHAIGAEYENKKVGNFADLTIFSFHPVKHITTGEGGAVATNNKEFYEKMLLLRSHGIDKSIQERYGSNATWAYDMKYLGRNYRMTDFQAALGISQLKKLDLFIKKRQKVVTRYKEHLKKIKEITLPQVNCNVNHAWHIYTILLDETIDRNAFFKYIKNLNIGVNVHYIPIYKHTYYKNKFNFDKNDYPITENIFKRIITLPLFPSITEQDIEYIIECIKKAIKNSKK